MWALCSAWVSLEQAPKSLSDWIRRRREGWGEKRTGSRVIVWYQKGREYESLLAVWSGLAYTSFGNGRRSVVLLLKASLGVSLESTLKVLALA